MKHENDEPEPLDPQAAAFLDSLRGADQPRSVDRRRIRRKVLVAVAATGVGAAASGGSTAAAAASGAATATGAGALSVGGAVAAKIWIGVTLGVVAVAGGVATLATPDAPEAPATEVAAPEGRVEGVERSARPSPAEGRSAPRELPAAPVPEPVPEPEPELSQGVPEAAPEPEAVSARPTAPSRAPRLRSSPRSAPAMEASPPAPAADTLREELALLRRAHAAASERKFSESLVILDEHERRFPNGSLAVEREGARVIALCGAGRRAEGRRRAERFAEVHPRSPLGPRVARACAE